MIEKKSEKTMRRFNVFVSLGFGIDSTSFLGCEWRQGVSLRPRPKNDGSTSLVHVPLQQSFSEQGSGSYVLSWGLSQRWRNVRPPPWADGFHPTAKNQNWRLEASGPKPVRGWALAPCRVGLGQCNHERDFGLGASQTFPFHSRSRRCQYSVACLGRGFWRAPGRDDRNACLPPEADQSSRLSAMAAYPIERGAAASVIKCAPASCMTQTQNAMFFPHGLSAATKLKTSPLCRPGVYLRGIIERGRAEGSRLRVLSRQGA